MSFIFSTSATISNFPDLQAVSEVSPLNTVTPTKRNALYVQRTTNKQSTQGARCVTWVSHGTSLTDWKVLGGTTIVRKVEDPTHTGPNGVVSSDYQGQMLLDYRINNGEVYLLNLWTARHYTSTTEWVLVNSAVKPVNIIPLRSLTTFNVDHLFYVPSSPTRPERLYITGGYSSSRGCAINPATNQLDLTTPQTNNTGILPGNFILNDREPIFVPGEGNRPDRIYVRHGMQANNTFIDVMKPETNLLDTTAPGTNNTGTFLADFTSIAGFSFRAEFLLYVPANGNRPSRIYVFTSYKDVLIINPNTNTREISAPGTNNTGFFSPVNTSFYSAAFVPGEGGRPDRIYLSSTTNIYCINPDTNVIDTSAPGTNNSGIFSLYQQFNTYYAVFKYVPSNGIKPSRIYVYTTFSNYLGALIVVLDPNTNLPDNTAPRTTNGAILANSTNISDLESLEFIPPTQTRPAYIYALGVYGSVRDGKISIIECE